MVGTYGGGGSGVLGGVHMSAGAHRSWVGAHCRLRVEGRPWGVIVIQGGVSSSVRGHRRPRVGHSWWGIVVRACVGIVVRRWGSAFHAWGSSLSVGGGSSPVVV